MRENGTPPTAGSPGPGGADDQTPELPEDGTLGGYLRAHDRPPGFEGSDGHPYTVSVEVEQVGDLRAPWGGYLVFPRWATGGLGVVGHVQSPILCRGRTRSGVEERVGELSLVEVKHLLETAIERRREEGFDW